MPRKSTKRLRDMTRKELITRLNRRYANCAGVPPASIVAIVNRILDKRKALKAGRKAEAKHKDKWNIIIEPLVAEIRSLQTRVPRWKAAGNTAMSTFHEAYLSALMKVRDILRHYQKQPLTPDERIREVKLPSDGILASSLKRIPVGHHWSDWVPARIRLEFMRAHANLQTTTKTRKLAPIFQRDPSKTVADQHARVIATWQDELNQLQNVIDRDGIQRRPHEAIQAQSIELAIKKAREQSKANRRITPYWSKMLTNQDRADIRKSVNDTIDKAGGRVRDAQSAQPSPQVLIGDRTPRLLRRTPATYNYDITTASAPSPHPYYEMPDDDDPHGDIQR